MQRKIAVSLAISGLLSAAVMADPSPTVTLSLTSPQHGRIVCAGDTIEWTISVTVSTTDNDGLALISCDLVQNPDNPAFLDIPPADSASIDGNMDDFSRPLGISNPGDGGTGTGYVGTQLRTLGHKDLVQVGGAQNTFGVAGTGDLGQDYWVNVGIGQGPQSQIVASGTFLAPTASGFYEYRLENALANVLSNMSPPPTPPAYWPVTCATVNLTGASFSFVIAGAFRGDLNCDGAVNVADIPHFVQALIDPAGYDADHDGDPYPVCQRVRADMDGNTLIDGRDIQGFVDALLP